MTSRLDAFFGTDDQGGVAAEDGVVPLRDVTEPLPEAAPDDSSRENVIASLLTEKERSPADDLLDDMHLSVFSDKKPATDDTGTPAGPAEKAGEISGELAGKLDDFFGPDDAATEATADGVVPLGEAPSPAAEPATTGQEPESPAADASVPEPGASPTTEPDLVASVQDRLANFFDQDDSPSQGMVDGVVPLEEVTPSSVQETPPQPEQASLTDLFERIAGYLQQPRRLDGVSLADDLQSAARSGNAVGGAALLIIRSLVLTAGDLDDDGLQRCRTLAATVSGVVDPVSGRGDSARFPDVVRQYVRFQDEIVRPRAGGDGGSGQQEPPPREKAEEYGQSGLVIEDIFIP